VVNEHGLVRTIRIEVSLGSLDNEDIVNGKH